METLKQSQWTLRGYSSELAIPLRSFCPRCSPSNSHLDAKWPQKHVSQKGCSSQETVSEACSVPLSRETRTTQAPDGLLKCCPLFSRWQTSSLRISMQPMPLVVPQYKVAFLPLTGIGSTKLFMRGCQKSMTSILLPWNQFWHSEGGGGKGSCEYDSKGTIFSSIFPSVHLIKKNIKFPSISQIFGFLQQNHFLQGGERNEHTWKDSRTHPPLLCLQMPNTAHGITKL